MPKRTSHAQKIFTPCKELIKGNMEKKYNAQNETSHTPNSDMAFDYTVKTIWSKRKT
jgi:hypothetical protein